MESNVDKAPRTLTDADVDALLNAAEKRFYLNLGKGLWGVVWKTVIGILIVIASVGYWSKQGG